MAKNLLTKQECQNFKNTTGKLYDYAKDGDNLFLRVDREQNKSWIVRLYRNGKESPKGLGSFPNVTLAKARELRDQYKEIWAQGKDPSVEKKKQKFESAKTLSHTFGYVQDQTFINSISTMSDRHQKRWKGLYKNYLKSQIGTLPLAEIDDAMILEIVEKIYKDKPQTANKVKSLVSVVFRYAIEKKWFKGINPAKLLEGNSLIKKPKNTRMKYLEEHRVGEFINALDSVSKDHQTAFIYILMVTALRVGSLRFAKWSWLNGATLTIPKDFMKNREKFVCPLPKQALLILNNINNKYSPRNNEYIFKSPNVNQTSPISDTAVRKLFQNLLGDNYSLHGFRTLFNRVVTKSRMFEIELIESQLTHAYTKTEIRMVYLGDEDFLDDRAKIVQYYANWIDDQAFKYKAYCDSIKKSFN